MTQYLPFTSVICADEFAQISKAAPLIVLLLWASWDPNSRTLDGWLFSLRDTFPKICIHALDLDDKRNWPLAVEWNIVTTPTLVCLWNGVVHERWIGLRTETELTAKLSEWQDLCA